MARSTDKIVNDYFERVRTQLDGWKSHLDNTQALTKDLVGGNIDSLSQLVSRVLAQGIECYDTAYGWLLPGNPLGTVSGGQSGTAPTSGTAAPGNPSSGYTQSTTEGVPPSAKRK